MTYQNDLGLVQFFLYFHDRIRLLGILVLCQIVCEGTFEFPLLSWGQTTGSRLGRVAAKRIGRGGAERRRCRLVGETGEERGMLVEDFSEERECGSERVFQIGDHHRYSFCFLSGKKKEKKKSSC